MERTTRRASLLLIVLWCIAGIGVVVVEAQRREEQSSCRVRTLRAREPLETIRSEGGITELSTRQDTEELNCAGVEFVRETIEPYAMSVPKFCNTPTIGYVTEGEGMLGVVIPGCPETDRRAPFIEEGECKRGRGRRVRREEEEEEREQRERETGRRGEGEEERLSRSERERAREESSQKVRRVQRGDVVAIPAGAAYWIYNDGDRRLRIVAIVDSSNHQNQLDRRYRPFYLAGSPATRERRSGGRPGEREGEEEEEERTLGGNMLEGFDSNILAEAWGVHSEMARRVQERSRRQQRGLIIRVGQRQSGRERPAYANSFNYKYYEKEKQQQVEVENSGYIYNPNPGGNIPGLAGAQQEAYCSMRLRHNADDPDDADVYVPDGGIQLTALNFMRSPR